jgi:nucleotide-binding universal stress UspA family protein
VAVTSYLLATASVHTTAAAADCLGDRLDPADTVTVVAVREPDAPGRDVGDAANVARSRLAAAAPTVETREGDPETEIRAAIDDHDPDELLLGPRRGVADTHAGVGSTARALLADLDRPAVVLPLPDLD